MSQLLSWCWIWKLYCQEYGRPGFGFSQSTPSPRLVSGPSDEPVGAKIPLINGLSRVSYGCLPLSRLERIEVVRLKPFCPPLIAVDWTKRPTPPRITVDLKSW